MAELKQMLHLVIDQLNVACAAVTLLDDLHCTLLASRLVAKTEHGTKSA